MKHVVDYGDGLFRLPDPEPDEWIKDKTKVLINTSTTWSTYGNFWSNRICTFRDHKWLMLKYLDVGPRYVKRCQRCGSQVCQFIGTTPPVRGEL